MKSFHAQPMPIRPNHALARSFRRAMTPPEARLWTCLRGSRFHGFKFRRQHPIGPYVLDFYCAWARLAVEIDGVAHEHPDRIAHGRRRTVWLADQGVRVIRLRASDVRDELEGVLGYIHRAVLDRDPT